MNCDDVKTDIGSEYDSTLVKKTRFYMKQKTNA